MPVSSSDPVILNTNAGNVLSGLTSTWGAISLSNIAFTSFNKGGTYFPNTALSPNSLLPATVGVGSPLVMNSLKGCYRYFQSTATITVGFASYISGETTFYRYGYNTNLDSNGSFGSISGTTSITTPTGTYTIEGFYYDTTGATFFLISKQNSYPVDENNTFVKINSTGYDSGSDYTRGSNLTNFSTHFLGTTYARRYWRISSVTYPTSGTSTFTISYYG